MTPFTTHPEGLGGLLRRQLDLLTTLRDLLAREAVALTSGGQAAILDLAQEKQRLGMELADLARRLESMLEGSDHPADGPGPGRLLDSGPDAEGLAGLRAQVVAALRLCLADNSSIGALVERRRRAVERALEVFFGAPEAASLYQASGRLGGVATDGHLIGAA